jgi:hypothetical protein
MQRQCCNSTTASNDDQSLHSLRRLELIQRSVVTQPTTTTNAANTFACNSPRNSPRRQQPSVAGSWQKTLYKPVFSQSPIHEKRETGTHLRASSLPNLALVVPNDSSSPPVSTMVPSKEQHLRRLEKESPPKQIEVAPGEFLRLIGAYETRDAVRDRRTVQTSCLVCSRTLICANQADCVLCPSCRVVSPITENNSSSWSSSSSPKCPSSFGGVGMGLFLCEFVELQQQLEQEDVNSTVWRLGASMSSF